MNKHATMALFGNPMIDNIGNIKSFARELTTVKILTGTVKGAIGLMIIALKAMPLVAIGAGVVVLANSFLEAVNRVRDLSIALRENREAYIELNRELASEERMNRELITRLQELQRQESLASDQRVEKKIYC